VTDSTIPGKQELEDAWNRIREHVHWTPMITSRTLEDRLGRPLALKPENLQRAGSFKIRGALNKILSLTDEEASRGVVSYSSGNHAQAVALAAGIRGISATIVMPPSAPRVKLEATEEYGAKVVQEGETASARREIAETFAKETGSIIIPPFDDPLIISGQSTVAQEILRDHKDVRSVYVPIGGGGLIAGTALAVHQFGKGVRVIGVEPEMASCMKSSMDAGKVISVEPGPTLADGLKPDYPGEVNLKIVQKYVQRIVLVSEEQIRCAMELLITRTKMVVEPSGAVSLAGAMFWGSSGDGNTVCILSGGNLDPKSLLGTIEG